MKVDFNSQLAITQLPTHPGFLAIVSAFKARISDVESQLAIPQKDWNEDIRLLQLWRGLKHACHFLEQLPKEIASQIDQNIRSGDPTAVPFVGSADEMDMAYIVEALRGKYPQKPAPTHNF